MNSVTSYSKRLVSLIQDYHEFQPYINLPMPRNHSS